MWRWQRSVALGWQLAMAGVMEGVSAVANLKMATQ